MNKTYSLLFTFILFATCLTSYGQDTVKKADKKPQGIIVPSVYHPITRPGYKHLGNRDSALKAKGITNAKPDTAKARVPAQPVYVDNTLTGQYNTLIKKMYAYERGQVEVFYKNYMDTLNTERRKLKDSTAKLAAQAKTIADLQGSTAAKEQALTVSIAKVNQMNLLGIEVSKTTFQYIMWGLVVVLAGFSVAIYSLSGASRREAAYRTQLNEELAAEFQAYKVKANDKEKKLARELQTERNKYDELKEQKDNKKK